MFSLTVASVVGSESAALTDGIEEDILRISSCLPHCEPTEVVGGNEVALGGERLSVIIRDHDLLFFAIKIGLS